MSMKQQIQGQMRVINELDSQVRAGESERKLLEEENSWLKQELKEELQRAKREDEREKALEATATKTERERRRLVEQLAQTVEKLEEERTERRVVEALLGKCSESLLWWARQSADQELLVAELRKREARRAGGAEETKEDSTAENAE